MRSRLGVLGALTLATGVVLALVQPIAQAAPPGAPVLNADVNSDESVDLVWSQVPGATQYRIFEDLRTPSNGTGAGIATDTDNWNRRGPNLPADTYRFFVVAENSDGQSAISNKVTVEVPYPLVGPDLTMVAPAPDAIVSGTVELEATCSTEQPCSLVEYLIDGQVVADDAAGDNTDGFKEPLDTTTLTNGNHYLQARGHRASNNSTYTSSPKVLTVNNNSGDPEPDPEPDPDPDPDPTPEPTPTKTDLSVDPPGVTGDNTMVNITAGEVVKFNGNWDVYNQPAGNTVRLQWLIDGVAEGYANYLSQNPGGYGSESYDTWTATEGTHTVEMKIDYLNEIDESNETNNTSSRQFTVAPGAATPVAEPALPASGPVPAADETQAFASGTGDIADDPAIWVDPTNSANSVVIGSKKAASGGGLAVYNLAGDQIQFLGAGELNNVDIRTVNGKVVVLTTERGSNTLKFFYFNPTTRQLTAAGGFATGFEPYGGCLYQNGANLYGFVTNRNSPWDFDQYTLTVGASAVTGSKVRDLTTSSLSESCVADDEAGTVYLSQETSGVYRYAAAPTGGTARTAIAPVGQNGVTADVEGLAIARGRGDGHKDHLIVSSQGANTYQVFEIGGPFKKSFTVAASGTVDAVTGTDGLEITRTDLGPLYPNGLLVVHDTSNSGGTASNFKYVDAGKVLGNYGAAPTPTPNPEPTPNPSPNRGPSGPVLVWEDDFENGLNCNIWVRVQNAETAAGPNSDCSTWAPNGSPTRTTFPQNGGEAGTGDRAARFEVREGDVSANGNRSEMSGDGASWRFGEGYEGWLQMRVKKDSSGMHDVILAQWHAGSGSPPLELGLEGSGELTIESLGVGTVPETVVLPAAQWPVGTWIDVNVHFKMSIGSGGGAQVYVNGVDKTGWLAGQTMGDGSSYLKMGLYRSPRAETYITHVDDARLTRK